MLVRVAEEIVVDDQPGTSGTTNAASGNERVSDQPGTSALVNFLERILDGQPGTSGTTNASNGNENLPEQNGRKEKESQEPPAKRRRK
jgi:hypothetical protein